MPDKIKTAVLYKQLINAYGTNGNVSPGAFSLDENSFYKKIEGDPVYAEKIYGAMTNAYGDGRFKLTKDQFLQGLGYDQTPGRPTTLPSKNVTGFNPLEPMGQPNKSDSVDNEPPSIDKLIKLSQPMQAQPTAKKGPLTDYETFVNTPAPAPTPTKDDIARQQLTENFANLNYVPQNPFSMRPPTKEEVIGRMDEPVARYYQQRKRAAEDAEAAEKRQMASQQAADEYYATPQGKLYYQLVRPVMKSLTETGGSMIGTSARLLGFDKAADKIVNYLSYDNAAREDRPDAYIFDEPTKLKGKLSIQNIVPRSAEALTGIASLLGTAELMGGGNTGLMASNFIQTHENYRKAAKAAGLSDGEADAYALTAAGVSSAMMPLFPLKGAASGELESALSRTGQGSVFNMIKNGATVNSAIQQGVKKFAKHLGETEAFVVGQHIADASVRYGFDKMVLDQPKFGQESPLPTDGQELAESMAVMAIAGSAMSAPGLVRASRPSALERSAWSTAAREPEKFNATVDRNVEQGNITPERAQQMKTDVAEYGEIYQAVRANGYDDNAASRMALDALRAKKLDEQNKPATGISVLAPIREQHEAAKATLESDIRDAAIGIPETGTQISRSELEQRMQETGGASKIKNLGDNDYRVNEINLNDLYKNNEQFRLYVDEGKLKPEADKEGLRNPPVVNADGTIVDGMNRLAQQYADGQKTTRAYVETRDINVQLPEDISKPRIIEPNLEEKGVSVTRPKEVETIKPKENAIQIESPREVDVRNETRNGETMGERNTQPEVPAGKGKETPVAPTEVPEAQIRANKKVPEPVEVKSGTRESRDAAVARLKEAWDGYKKMGIIDDPAAKLKRDKEFYGSLLNYMKEEILYRVNTVKNYMSKNADKRKRELIKQMAKEGIPVQDAEMVARAFKEANEHVSKIPGVAAEEKTITTRQYIKDKMLTRIKSYEKGLKKGTKEGGKEAISNAREQVKIARKAIFETLKEAKGKFTRGNIKSITAPLDRVIRNANGKPEAIKRAIDKAIDRAAQVVNDVNNKKQISDTRGLLKQLRKLRKNEGMVKQDVDWISGNQFPDPSKVEDIQTYSDMLKDFIDARKGNKTDFKYTKEEISEFIDKENNRIYEEKEARLQSELDDMKEDGLVAEDMTLDQYKEMLANPTSVNPSEVKPSKDDVLREALTERKEELRDRLPEFEGHEKDIAKQLVDVDISKLNSIDLRVFNNILNNAAEYGTFDRAGDIIAADRANKIVDDLSSKKYKVRILPSEKVMDKNTLSNTISSLFYNNQAVADVRSKTLGPVEIAISKYVKPAAAKNAEEIAKIFKQHDMSSLSNKKLDAYAFLNQWKSVEPAEIAAELQSGLDKRISDIEYNFDRYKKLGEKEGEAFRHEATTNADALRELGLIEDYEVKGTGDDAKIEFTKKDNLFTEDDPTGPLRDAFDKLTDGEKAAYKHATDKFLETRDAVEDYAREYRGADFNEWPGGIYFPRTAIKKNQIEEKPSAELNLNNQVTDNFRSLSKKPAGLIKSRAEKFSDEVFYDTDFFTNSVRGYYDALYTSKVMPEVQKLDRILRHPDFKKMITDVYRDRASKRDKNRTQGEENYGKFKQQLVNALNEEKSSPYIPRQGVDLWGEIVSRQVKGLLGNVYQAPKQYIPAVINNMSINNPVAVVDAIGGRFKALVDPAYRQARRDLLSNFTGVQRSIKGNAAYDKAFKSIDESKSWYQNPLDWHSKLQEIASLPLEKSDIAAQQDLYMASYITSLLHQGKIKSTGEFDIFKESANPNKEAIAYAEQIAAEVNNESAKGYRPNVIKDKRAQAKILWMLQSFNLNAFGFARQKAKVAFGMEPGATTADRIQAWRHLVGYAGQVATYNVISKFTRAAQLAVGYALVNALFGIGKEYENKELKKDESIKDWYRIGASGVSDLFLGGMNTVYRSAIQGGINEAYNVYKAREIAKMKAAQEQAEDNEEDFKPQKIKGTYLDPTFEIFYSSEAPPGESAFYFNLFKKFANQFMPKKKSSDDTDGMLPEDRRLHELSKYVATPTQALGISDFILFERGMENALRRNKKNKKANSKEEDSDF